MIFRNLICHNKLFFKAPDNVKCSFVYFFVFVFYPIELYSHASDLPQDVLYCSGAPHHRQILSSPLFPHGNEIEDILCSVILINMILKHVEKWKCN